jgi:hypothetical protein
MRTRGLWRADAHARTAWTRKCSLNWLPCSSPNRGQTPPAVYAGRQQRLSQREALVQIRTQVRNQRHALLRQPRIIAAVQQRMDALLDTLGC